MIDTPTGGQYCVMGIVFQLIAGIDRGVGVLVNAANYEGSELIDVVMTIEPADGGDHRIETVRERLVEQVKIRTNGKPWTAGDIAEGVLGDLALAVRGDGVPSRYRLVTDGALNCEDLIRFAAALSVRPVPSDIIGALDDEDGRAYKYGRWLSERGYFQALMRRAEVSEPLRFWHLLAALELEGDVSEEMLVGRIDAVLGRVVDGAEDIPHKRKELIGAMALHARKGVRIGAAALLAEADMPAERLLHAGRLPAILEDHLADKLRDLGYDAAHDVRDAPQHERRDLLLISGDSGYGKSWRLAALLAAKQADGKLALLVTNARSLEDVSRAIIERSWLSGFDKPLDLPALGRRLGKAFEDDAGIWLTVGIDDIHDRNLLHALHGARWADHGIRLAATVPTQLADEMAKLPVAPAELRVGSFSLAQLRRFLVGHRKPVHDLPDDVAELLCIPIFAELYRRVADEGWAPANEYELIDRFWRRTTFERHGMADAQDDIVALQAAARGLLEPSGVYPWPTEDALAAGLHQEARARLIKAGVLRAGAGEVAVMHDRVLNWLVARALAADLKRHRRTPAEVASILGRFEDPEAIAAGLAYRLGYVLLDLFWMAANTLEPATVRALIEAVLDAPAMRIHTDPFIKESVADLGPRILPAFELLARAPDPGHDMRGRNAAKAIGLIGRRHAGSVDGIAAGLLAEGQGDIAESAGLIVAAEVALPSVIERLWTIHRARRAVADAHRADEDIQVRHDYLHAAAASAKALYRAAAAAPGWIEAKLGQTHGADSAALLLDLLLGADHGAARDVWPRTKAEFLSRIPAGRRVVPRAIGHFGDRDEIDRLHQRADEEGEFLDEAYRFDALLRIAPERVADEISSLPPDLLGSRSRYAMRRLVRASGEEGQARLLARHGKGWEAMRDIALAYLSDPELIDAPAFEATLDALEARLAELEGQEWEPRGEGHLICFLAETRRSDLLARLRLRRGSRLEHLLADKAIARRSRPDATVDIDGEHFERLLLAIGGEGYGKLVAASISRDTVFGRRNGYDAAQRLPRGSPDAAALGDAVATPDGLRHVDYELMLALAVQGQDEALYAQIAATEAAYNDAFDVRAKEGGWAPAVETRIRRDLESDDSKTRIGALCALPFSPPADIADLLADTLARCPDDDISALTAVRIANELEHYRPRSLPQLKRMLALPDPKWREAVLPYLASYGDSEARAVVTESFTSEAVPVLDNTALKASHAIAAYEKGTGPAIERLRLFIDRRHGFYPLGVIAARLFEQGALGNDALVELGYSARRVSPESSEWLIERIARFDPGEAFAIAERHYGRLPSAPGAKQILLRGGDKGLDHLLRRYASGVGHSERWLLARAFRRHAPRAALVARLGDWARGNSVDLRIAAAELLGWLNGSEADALREQLFLDVVPDVSDAALRAIARADDETHARRLLAELRGADHLARWSILYALIALADPYLLEADPDGLALGDTIDELDEIFAIEAEKAMKARKEALEKQAERRDREDRD